MNILICDDEAVFRQWLEQQVTREAQRLQICAQIHSIPHPNKIDTIVPAKIGIAFLDVDFGNANGIDLADQLRKSNPQAVLESNLLREDSISITTKYQGLIFTVLTVLHFHVGFDILNVYRLAATNHPADYPYEVAVYGLDVHHLGRVYHGNRF